MQVQVVVGGEDLVYIHVLDINTVAWTHNYPAMRFGKFLRFLTPGKFVPFRSISLLRLNSTSSENWSSNQYIFG